MLLDSIVCVVVLLCFICLNVVVLGCFMYSLCVVFVYMLLV